MEGRGTLPLNLLTKSSLGAAYTYVADIREYATPTSMCRKKSRV